MNSLNLFGCAPSVQFKSIWSAGATWSAGQEDFIRSAADWIDRLDLRFSYGLSGNSPVPASVTTDDDLVRFIVDERMREYMMTGLRWFDLRRLWNDPLFPDLKSACTHTDGTNVYTLTEERLTYRIPPQVLDFSSDWTDND